MGTRTKYVIASGLIAIGILGRLLPHAWNFAPIVAIGLFAGARLGKGYGLIVPGLAMFLSDVFIGFYDWQINASVYIAMMLTGTIGLFIRRTKNPLCIAAASIAGSTLFYLVTNAAVWYFGTMYNPGISGLYASLFAGMPFFRNAIVGDIWYSLATFGAYELAVFGYSKFMMRKIIYDLS